MLPDQGQSLFALRYFESLKCLLERTDFLGSFLSGAMMENHVGRALSVGKGPTILSVSLGAFAFLSAYGVTLGALPAELLQRNIGASEVGFIIGLHAAGAIGFRVLLGGSIDQFGARNVSALAVCALVCATLLLAITMIFFDGHLLILGLSKVVQGAATSAFLTAGYTYVAQSSELDQRGQSIGLFGSLASLGMLIPPAVGIWIWAQEIEWLIWCIPLAFAFTAAWRLPGDQRLKNIVNDQEACPSMSILWQHYSIIIPALSLGLAAALQGGAEAHLPRFVREFKADEFIIHLYVVFGLAVAIGRIFSGKLLDRIGSPPILYVGFATIFLSMMAPLLMSGLFGILACSILLGIGSGTISTVSIAMLGNAVPPQNSASAIGLGGLTADVGLASGAFLTGLIISSGGTSAFLITGLVCVGSMLMVAIFFKIHVVKS
jgi:MFS family permease